MQPFLSKAPRTTCCYHSTIGSVTVYRRFGEFYKRFYSAVVDGQRKDDEGDKGAGGGGGGSAGGGGIDAKERDRWKEFKPSVSHPKVGGNGGTEEHRVMPHALRKHIEGTTKALTTRVLEHDRLVRDLRAEIVKWHRRDTGDKLASEHKGGKPSTHSDSEFDQLEMLKKTLQHITHRYYQMPERPNSEGEGPDGELVGGPNLKSHIPYIPPFPEYVTPGPPTELNESLIKLLSTRPPPIAFLPKICYNLLTSPKAPDIETFNILMLGLTRLRQNSLSHVLFHALLEGGLGPKVAPNEGTIIRLINLCVKSGDYAGFLKVMNIHWRQQMRPGKTREERRRSKPILEAIIYGFAKFGNSDQVLSFLRTLARECPDSPEPSMWLWTAILKLYTEQSDWPQGIRTWKKIMKQDAQYQTDGTGERADFRAFHQMYKLCEECGNQVWTEAVLTLAAQRGWDKEALAEKPNKGKGVWFRRQNKAPNYVKGRGVYMREVEGKDLLRALDYAWAMQDLAEDPRYADVDYEDIEKMLEDPSFDAFRLRYPAHPPPRKKPLVSKKQKIRTWEEILDARMKVVSEKLKARTRRRFSKRKKPRKRRRKGEGGGGEDEASDGEGDDNNASSAKNGDKNGAGSWTVSERASNGRTNTK
ncbi:hypothetical protein L873DRAFT_1718357 [Choiromyces venosus 120613-1]|uniref:Uncharacterized protein n=1 Tax=Choiromyces venosus 120613-1 TaxID=1336337 RepID=A0A3N4J1I6_9PEZI|nr:hypothetical protein L873DRAFT_1718357 [Choiromyces venosus 120613-1]